VDGRVVFSGVVRGDHHTPCHCASIVHLSEGSMNAL
jgi:hypothetical protein